MQRRIAPVVATLVFMILAVAGLALHGPHRRYLVELACLVLAYLVPASHLTSVGDVLHRWPFVLACILGATFLWDVGLTVVAGARHLFANWFLVYPSSLLVFGSLLLASAAAVSLLGRRAKTGGGQEEVRSAPARNGV